MYRILLIHSSFNGHWVASMFFAAVNNADMNMEVQIFPWKSAFSSLGRDPDVELLHHMPILLFYFLKNYHPVFHRSCINLNFHQQYLRVPVSLYPHHPDECEEVSYCIFDLPFPSDDWCWTSSHVLIGYLYTSPSEKCLFLCPLLN